MKYEPVKDYAERKRISALIEQCEKEQRMSEQVNLISQSDALELIAKYADKYPSNSCDTYTRSIGNLLGSMAIDMIRDVPIKATLSLKGTDE